MILTSCIDAPHPILTHTMRIKQVSKDKVVHGLIWFFLKGACLDHLYIIAQPFLINLPKNWIKNDLVLL